MSPPSSGSNNKSNKSAFYLLHASFFLGLSFEPEKVLPKRRSTFNGLHGAISQRIVQYIRRRGSVVGIVTGYGLDDQEVGVRVPVGSRIFSSPSHPDVAST
jgi:hypothetical protein